MVRGCNPPGPVPPGMPLESVDGTSTAVVTTMRSSGAGVECPGCGGNGHHVHGRYTRSLADLPLSGRPAILKLLVRRFRCDRVPCTRRILSERLAAAIRWVRHTARLGGIVHRLGLALRSRLAAGSAQRL